MTDRTATAAATRPLVPGAGTLALLGLGWLLAMLSSARGVIGAESDYHDLVITQVASALPGVVTASLLAATALGLFASHLLARRAPGAVHGTARPLGLGAGIGAATGLATAAPIALAYPGLPSLPAICGAVVAAALLGGLVSGLRARRIVAAGAAGALGVFAVRFVQGIFNDDLLGLFGARGTAESHLTANGWVVLLAALAAGVAAGALGYAYLRRTGPAGQRWPAYLAAGAMPGLLLLSAEVITRVGGAGLADVVSAEDRVVLTYQNAGALNTALIVMFVGALVAIFLLGRTLGKRPAPDPSGETAPDASGGSGGSGAQTSTN